MELQISVAELCFSWYLNFINQNLYLFVYFVQLLICAVLSGYLCHQITTTTTKKNQQQYKPVTVLRLLYVYKLENKSTDGPSNISSNGSWDTLYLKT